jgi:hypothetical protein
VTPPCEPLVAVRRRIRGQGRRARGSCHGATKWSTEAKTASEWNRRMRHDADQTMRLRFWQQLESVTSKRSPDAFFFF